MLKLKFNSNLKYQNDAVKAVTSLFEGQNSVPTYFTIPGQTSLYSNNGIGNRLMLSKEEILENNLKRVQRDNKIIPSNSEKVNSLDFTVEMETGTGKTYVYLKTIFELNKKYDFTKFIIVVPSKAIREGVYKSLEITQDHFKYLYDNVIYDYFIYDSQKLDQVRNFCVNSNIQIMVINIDAFRRSFSDPSKENMDNIIHRFNDKLNGLKPIELIQETNPIVIIDEPQSSASTDKSKVAIKNLNPLCTLQYSATPKEKKNLIYKLDAVDAYNKNLVKQIEVASLELVNDHSTDFMELISVTNKPFRARIKLNANVNGQFKHEKFTIKQGDNLASHKLANNEVYDSYTVEEIYCNGENKCVKFTNDKVLPLGNIQRGIEDNIFKNYQIRQTIIEHLDKELEYYNMGIKVLTLFFIDKVENYRKYDREGNCYNGSYAEMFEKNYEELINQDKYQKLPSKILDTSVSDVHGGYFSKDNTGGNSIKDIPTYNAIMKDKEKLLSFNNSLRFIFSHSALREGWDNPNVFQICTLNQTKSNLKKHQEIGRGLRLCVNQEGNRVKDPSINILTIMANENYEDFANSLQSEMMEEGFKFGYLEKSTFLNLPYIDENGNENELNENDSTIIFDFFKEQNYINNQGKIQNELKFAIENNELILPESYQIIKKEIYDIIKKFIKEFSTHKSKSRRKIEVNKEVFTKSEFKKLWDKIKYKTTYSVNFDSNILIKNCSRSLNEQIHVESNRLVYKKNRINITDAGVEEEIPHIESIPIDNKNKYLPDILEHLQNETFLTRRTLVKILIKSNTLNFFKLNPNWYLEKVTEIIKIELNHLIIEGIKYQKLEESYKQELFEERELYCYLDDSKTFKCTNNKSVYNYIRCDSKVEVKFAENLDKNENVIVYTKLPYWFKINTPIGGYNPDWAIYYNDYGEEKIYFVIETKGGINPDKNYRISEANKIKCGKKHFTSLGDVKFYVVDTYEQFVNQCTGNQN